MKLIEKFIPDGLPCDTKKYFPDNGLSSITIHWIGPYPHHTPDIVRDWWIKSKGEASAHYIIKDAECIQCWPINKIAWHAGCSAGNNTSLGIEVVPQNVEGIFSESSIQTLKELLATLPKLKIVRHFDWTKKECPKYYCDDKEWQKLLVKISQ